MQMPTYLWYIILIAAVLVFFIIAVFNSLSRLRNRTQEAWSDIDVQLKRRHDLIPNLLETVKGYAAHEQGVFEKVTEARTAAVNAEASGDKKQMEKAENALSQTLKSLFAVAEAYPDLKASANFGKLQDELSDTENKIQAARRFYNANVRDFNTKCETFPSNAVAGMFGFKNFDFFAADETEKQNVEVKF
jgi:LemA protein